MNNENEYKEVFYQQEGEFYIVKHVPTKICWCDQFNCWFRSFEDVKLAISMLYEYGFQDFKETKEGRLLYGIPCLDNTLLHAELLDGDFNKACNFTGAWIDGYQVLQKGKIMVVCYGAEVLFYGGFAHAQKYLLNNVKEVIS